MIGRKAPPPISSSTAGVFTSTKANCLLSILPLGKVGVHDNFISLGGHSLAAIRLTARINEEIEYNFPLKKIFELPTIAEYLKYIEETLTFLLEE
ncbi:phosphopantetheine-binding protein [Zobellia uliginosa]|uniref:phosphopantetheine-binding protein n=1 Tax=Zobellia uliginosa TaxID=143224 RepID=UPI0026E3F744|nr:phosphopantetheine-binding protein [Zobellia uliginosa]MDO6518255.1 phosphopantetheine-binding protein [Zobellia uliginosa]